MFPFFFTYGLGLNGFACENIRKNNNKNEIPKLTFCIQCFKYL